MYNTHFLRKVWSQPSDACKHIFFIYALYISVGFIVTSPYCRWSSRENLFQNGGYSEHRQGVRKHTSLGERSSHAERERI